MADKKKKKPPVKNFKEFDPSQFIETEPKLTEAIKKDLVVISFGRMNPVTVGHEKLVNQVLNVASKNGGDPAIYLSHSSDPKKNPLSYEDKVFFAQRAFGKIVKKSPARTIIEVAKQLQGLYKNLTVVVGSDRVTEFKTLLNKYNGKDYNFNKINVVSAGDRDPDAEGVEGMSASKMRAAAADGDFKSFKSGLPKKLQSTAKKVYDTTRQGMALDEETMDEAVLSRAQRRKRARLLRRYKSKIAIARKKAMRRRASLDVLKRRARKTARNMIKQKLAKSRRFADLDPAAKIAIEKRLEKMPSSRLDRLARKLLPSLRRKETERMQSRSKNESVNIDDMFEMFMEERSPAGRLGKNVHDIKVKVPGRVTKAIKKASPEYDRRENEPHKTTGKHLKDIMQKHGVKPSGKRHYHSDMTGHYMLSHPDNDPAKVHAAATEFEKTVGKAVRTEAKDGDGVNIVKDREFKGKPMKKEPGKIGIKFSDMRKSKWAKDSDANPKRSKAMGEATELEESKWVTPHHSDEHDEVHTQSQAPHGTYPDHVHKMLNHLKDKDNYHKAMKNGKSMTISPMSAKGMSNTDAAMSHQYRGGLDKDKQNRVKKLLKSKKVTKPIILHDTHTGHKHLLAGNTRLTLNTRHGTKKTPVHAITYDSSKMHKEEFKVDLDEAEMSLYDKIKAARTNPSPDKPVKGRGSKNRNPKTYDVRNTLDKEDDRLQTMVKKKLKKEEVELDEKLKASDDMGTWIKDFQDSDAPQFKGKSKEKRRQMAIAAKLDAEDDVKKESFDPKHVKMAIGIASDKRYAGGNMTGAVKQIDKIKKGLSDHPQVRAVLKRQNEETKTESLDEMWGTYVSKRPHMLLDKNNKVKFDKRFKMFRKQKELEEGFTVNTEMDMVRDLENSINEFLELHEAKTIKVDHTAALNAETAGYVLVKDREVIATGTMDEMLEMHEDTPGSRVWLSTKEVGDLVE